MKTVYVLATLDTKGLEAAMLGARAGVEPARGRPEEPMHHRSVAG